MLARLGQRTGELRPQQEHELRGARLAEGSLKVSGERVEVGVRSCRAEALEDAMGHEPRAQRGVCAGEERRGGSRREQPRELAAPLKERRQRGVPGPRFDEQREILANRRALRRGHASARQALVQLHAGVGVEEGVERGVVGLAARGSHVDEACDRVGQASSILET
ncbi:MAG TPA: hypothetical protein PK141_08045 [Polyangiaceae bacterium]|nr:hypothetical protein [Polyangiaceae bacterium]